MADAVADEGFLLGVLNSTPIGDDGPTDLLADADRARARMAAAGGLGSAAEVGYVLEVRHLLQAVVRGEHTAEVLAPFLRDVRYEPAIRDGRLAWTLSAPPDRRLAVRAILTWAALDANSPGRLRPCANGECRLFLIDHSKAGTARWCSMASCGNRLKARRHYQRVRSTRQA
jgi:predicted RNA-binding Zn ribbon-like protein